MTSSPSASRRIEVCPVSSRGPALSSGLIVAISYILCGCLLLSVRLRLCAAMLRQQPNLRAPRCVVFCTSSLFLPSAFFPLPPSPSIDPPFPMQIQNPPFFHFSPMPHLQLSKGSAAALAAAQAPRAPSPQPNEERTVIVFRNPQTFNFNIVEEPGTHGIFITSVGIQTLTQPAGALRPGDRIIAVDGHDTTTASREEAVALIRNAASQCTLRVRYELTASGAGLLPSAVFFSTIFFLTAPDHCRLDFVITSAFLDRTTTKYSRKMSHQCLAPRPQSIRAPSRRLLPRHRPRPVPVVVPLQARAAVKALWAFSLQVPLLLCRPPNGLVQQHAPVSPQRLQKLTRQTICLRRLHWTLWNQPSAARFRQVPAFLPAIRTWGPAPAALAPSRVTTMQQQQQQQLFPVCAAAWLLRRRIRKKTAMLTATLKTWRTLVLLNPPACRRPAGRQAAVPGCPHCLAGPLRQPVPAKTIVSKEPSLSERSSQWFKAAWPWLEVRQILTVTRRPQVTTGAPLACQRPHGLHHSRRHRRETPVLLWQRPTRLQSHRCGRQRKHLPLAC